MMGVRVMSLLLATLFAGFMLGRASESVSISIAPDRCMAAMQTYVDITCKVDDAFDQQNNEMTLIEVSRNDEMPIAYLRHCGNVTHRNDVSDQFKADGHIGNDSDPSYLKLTLTNPRSEDTGIYTCIIFYIDANGILQQEKQSQNLMVEKLDVSSLEIVLTQIKQKLSEVETNSDKKIQDLLEKSKKDTDMIAFSATKNSSSFLFTKGSDVIFSDVIMALGEGYDARKGVFTAPKPGLYVFHLLVRMKDGNYRMSINLMANAEYVARLYAGDSSYPDQSAVTGVVYLAAGDKVKAVVDGIYGNGEVQGYSFSVFSGYLINSN